MVSPTSMDTDSAAAPHDGRPLHLEDGARVGVLGGGPAGSMFGFFLLDMAERVGIDLTVELYESRDFTKPAPQGCNMCGGIISETLVQNLAAEGINLPPTIVQRGIDSYVLHTDTGSTRIGTPLQEKRIGAVHRGPGPRDIRERKWGSFDGHLQSLAVEKGVKVIPGRVDRVDREDGLPRLAIRGGDPAAYDLLAVAVGVNSPTLKLFEEMGLAYKAPATSKTFIREYYLGEEGVDRILGSSMHVFLLNLPRLEFGAVVPKGDYISVCLLGEDIDKDLIRSFLEHPEVRSCFPADLDLEKGSCQCSPRINVQGSSHPFADRIVFLGDCGVTRLYKDGIGAAYRTAKAAARTAVFQGVSARDFEDHYLPVCRSIARDNAVGKLTFGVTRGIQKLGFAQDAVLHMTEAEQDREGSRRRMSGVLWDMFTGSAPYRDILNRTLHPAFLGRFAWNLASSLAGRRTKARN